MRRVMIVFALLGIAVVSGWQYALLRDYPMADAISDIVPSPDERAYATILHYRSRLPFRPAREYIAIEVGAGMFDQEPRILHFIKRPVREVDLAALSQRRLDDLIAWKADSSKVRIQLDGNPMVFDVKPSTPPAANASGNR